MSETDIWTQTKNTFCRATPSRLLLGLRTNTTRQDNLQILEQIVPFMRYKNERWIKRNFGVLPFYFGLKLLVLAVWRIFQTNHCQLTLNSIIKANMAASALESSPWNFKFITLANIELLKPLIRWHTTFPLPSQNPLSCIGDYWHSKNAIQIIFGKLPNWHYNFPMDRKQFLVSIFYDHFSLNLLSRNFPLFLHSLVKASSEISFIAKIARKKLAALSPYTLSTNFSYFVHSLRPSIIVGPFAIVVHHNFTAIYTSFSLYLFLCSRQHSQIALWYQFENCF